MTESSWVVEGTMENFQQVVVDGSRERPVVIERRVYVEQPAVHYWPGPSVVIGVNVPPLFILLR